jgi:hypothetical protein
VHLQHHPVQVQRREGVADDQAGRLGAEALVPAVLLADGDAEDGVAVLEVDGAQARHADRLVHVAADDHQRQVVLALAEAVDEALLGAQAHGAVRLQGARHLRVVEPGLHQVGVLALQRAQVHRRADQEGVVHGGPRGGVWPGQGHLMP